MKYIQYSINIIKSYFYDIYYYLFENISNRKNAYNYKIYKSAKLYPDYLKKGHAMHSIQYLANKYCEGKGLDIGAGKWPFNNSRAIENNYEENAYKLKDKENSLDYIFSSHLLEHLKNPHDAIIEWYKKIKIGGYIFLYLPHPSCEMWKKENLKYHLWNPDPNYLEDYFSTKNQFKIEYMTYQPDGYMSFVFILKKIS